MGDPTAEYGVGLRMSRLSIRHPPPRPPAVIDPRRPWWVSADCRGALHVDPRARTLATIPAELDL